MAPRGPRRLPFLLLLLAAGACLLPPLLHHSHLSPSPRPSANDGAAPASRADHGRGNILRVATWNLRVPFPPDVDKNLSWSHRAHSVASAIARWRPHVLAVQEDCRFMTDDLMTTRTEVGELAGVYSRYGLFNRNGESDPTDAWPTNAFSPIVGRDGEHNSVWYDRSRFSSLRNVTFWLSRTPDAAGSSFDEVTGRVANCVWLKDRLCSGCSSIFFCSTHLPSGNATRQLWSVDVLTRKFSQCREDFRRDHPYDDEPTMMVAGDFNAAPGSETHSAMIEAGFVDARHLSREGTPIGEYTHTTNDWYGNPDSLIDYIWIYREARARSNVISVRHMTVPCCDSPSAPEDGPLDRTASDHLMVVADFASG